MAGPRSFEHGFGAGTLLMVGAQAGHWFITPAAHPAASVAQTAGVWVQLVVGLGGSFWLFWRERRPVLASPQSAETEAERR